MGAWGPAIFSDDLACDIRDEYRELLEDGVPDDEATRRIIDSYAYLDVDQAHTLWLALAAAQARLGRLDPSVRDKALAIIDGDVGLELWAAEGSRELAKRKAALARLKETLTGPQKPPSRVRKPWAHITDLTPGDILSFTRPSGEVVLFRVARLNATRVGTSPILRRLDWSKSKMPSPRKLQRLTAIPDPGLGAPDGTVFEIHRFRKKDADWSDVGFTLVGHVEPHDDDATCWPRISMAWRAMQRGLNNGDH